LKQESLQSDLRVCAPGEPKPELNGPCVHDVQ